jgi:hypothetical protein
MNTKDRLAQLISNSDGSTYTQYCFAVKPDYRVPSDQSSLEDQAVQVLQLFTRLPNGRLTFSGPLLASSIS